MWNTCNKYGRRKQQKPKQSLWVSTIVVEKNWCKICEIDFLWIKIKNGSGTPAASVIEFFMTLVNSWKPTAPLLSFFTLFHVFTASW